MPTVRRHILIMSSWFPTRIDEYSGNFVERFAYLLADRFEVTVVHTMSDPRCKNIEVDERFQDGVRTIRVYHPKKKIVALKWWVQRKALNKAFDLIDHVDLIFAHVFLPRAHQFSKAQHHFNCPMILLEHGSYFRQKPKKMLNPFQKRHIRKASRNCRVVAAVSEVLKKDMQGILPTTKIQVLPNFVDPDVFTLRATNPTERKKFIHISTLDNATKNIDTLFDGFLNAYLASNKTISLTIVSDQPTDELQKWARLNRCEAGFRFVGPSSSQEIAKLIQEHDALLVTSAYETFGIVIAEAWMTGTPVVSTSVGIATQMPAFLGVQIETNSIVDYKQALLSLAAGNFQYDSIAIRNHAMQFSRNQVLNILVELFEQHFEVDE